MEITVIIIAFLAVLILGHELGHFLAAKAFKVRVDEFGFGFPPRIFSRQKGETKYSFNLLPFGGFVRLHGEHWEENPKGKERSFVHQAGFKRAIILIAGVFANFLIGWLALSAVFYFGVPNKVIIEEILVGSPAEIAGLKAGEAIEGYGSVDEFLNFVDARGSEPIMVNGKMVTPRMDTPDEGK